MLLPLPPTLRSRSGSGKSYATRTLSATFNIPAYDLDELFWDPQASTYGVRAAPTVRGRHLALIVQRETRIIEGVYYGWLSPSFAQADSIFLLVGVKI